MIYTRYYDSPVGILRLTANAERWLELEFLDEVPASETTSAETVEPLERAAVWLDAYFAGKNPSIPDDLLLPIGSAFREMVWQELLAIPYGETTTYGQIAKQIAARRGLTQMSSRAVGSAIGKNPLAIIIPCHRVIGVNGSLTGFGGGLWRKATLLNLEGVKTKK